MDIDTLLAAYERACSAHGIGSRAAMYLELLIREAVS